MIQKEVSGKRIETTPGLEVVFEPKSKNEKKDTMMMQKQTYFTEKDGKYFVSKKLASYKIYK